MRAGTRSFLAGAAAGVLLAACLRALLSTLFFLSLRTLRLNGTAAWTLVLLAPLLAPLLPRGRWPLALLGASAASLPLLRLTDAYVPAAALGAAAGLVALAQADAPRRLGTLGGFAAAGVLLVPGLSHDPLLSLPGTLLSLLLALGALLAWREGEREARRPRAWAGVAWASLLLLELAFLASPFALARQVGAPAWATALLGVAGLAAGFALPRGARAWPLAPVGLLALVDVALVRSPLVLLSLAAAQLALGAAAARIPPPQGVAMGATLAPAAFVVVFFGATLGAAEWPLLVLGLAAAPLAALLAGARAPVPAPAPGAAALALAGLLVLPSLCAPAPVAPDGEEIVVVGWNVRQGFGNRGALDPALYVEALRAMEPDVVVLQEADTTRLSSGGLDVVHLLARELGMRPATQPSGVAVLSRFPLAEGVEPPAPREWTATAALDVRGQTVWVQGVHLARSSAQRALQVSDILDAANATPGPRVLAGDLNSCPEGACFGGRPADGVHDALDLAYEDAWLAHHGEEDPSGFTHPSSSPRRRIDVVMARGLEVVSAGPVRDGRTVLGSDHLPVRAVLRLPGEAEEVRAPTPDATGGASPAPRDSSPRPPSAARASAPACGRARRARAAARRAPRTAPNPRACAAAARRPPCAPAPSPPRARPRPA